MIQARLFTKRSALLGLFVVIVAGCVSVFDLSRHANWTPDGFIYARMMLEDTGAPDVAARQTALQFYLTTAVGRNPRYRPYFIDERLGMFTPEAKPFASRVLYPYLASLLYRTYGFQSLILISLVAYILAALGLFALLSYFGEDWLAAIIALAVMATPLMRTLGASALTDMLALSFWIWGLVCAVAYLRQPRPLQIVILTCCCIGIALARPAIYLPFGLAFGVLVWSLRNRRYVRSISAFLAAALVGSAAYAFSAHATHTPGLGTHLHWLYRHALTGWLYANPRALSAADRHSFVIWYIHDVIWVSVRTLLGLVIGILPSLVLVAAVVGLYVRRDSVAVTALAWAAVFDLLGILANPVVWELPRLVEAPLYPILAVGIVLLVMLFNNRGARPQPGLVPDPADARSAI